MGMILNPYTGSSFPAGLVGWWKGEGNLNDELGLNNLSANGSGLTYVTGQDGQAINYAGSGYAQLAAINVGSTWSLTLYWRGNATIAGGGAGILGGATNVANVFGGLGGVNWANPPSSNAFFYRQNSVTSFNGNDDRLIFTNKWYKLTFRYVAGTLYFHINHVFVGSYTATQNWNQIVRFCSQPTNGNYASSVDDIKLWNIDVGAPTFTTPNLWAQYNCASNVEVAHADYSWDAYTNGSESYADDADGSPNGSWYHNNSANDVRSLPPMRLGSAWTILFDCYYENTSGVNGGILVRAGSSDGLMLTTSQALIWREGGSNYLVTPTGFLVHNTWVGVKITYDGSKIRMYKNGSLFATESGTHSRQWVPSTMGVVQTGVDPFGSGRFRGRIDNLKFYNAVV